MERVSKKSGSKKVQRKKSRRPVNDSSPLALSPMTPQMAPAQLLYLQRTIGNHAVQNLLHGTPPTTKSPAIVLRKSSTAAPAIQRDWLDDLGSAASSAYDKVSDAAGSAYDTAKSAVSSAYDSARDAVGSAYDKVSDAASDALSFDIEGFVSSLRQKVEAHAKGMLGSLSQDVASFSSGAREQLGDLPDLPDSLTETAQQLVAAIPASSEEDISAVDALWETLKAGSTRLEQSGDLVNHVFGDVEAIKKSVQKTADTIRKEVNSIIDGAIAGVASVITSIQPYIAALKRWVEDLIDSAIQLAKKTWEAIEQLINKIKPYLTKPWFWLNLLTGGIYGAIARRAFKAGYTHYLPKKLIDHYADFGGPLKLSAKEMEDCAVEANLMSSTDFITQVGDLSSKGGGTKHITVKGHAVAATHGTLGNFTITYDGDLTVTPLAGGKISWSFDGQMHFYDFWDFDPKPFGKGGRSTYGEILTRIGDWFLPGKGFDINSEDVPFKQTNADPEGSWSGKGVAGVPSRLAVELSKGESA